MGQRVDLQALLEAILGSDKVYFQPPNNISLQYPCIIYKRDDILATHANNRPYQSTHRYEVTVVDRNPDSPFPGLVGQLSSSAFNRFFTADNLNHDVYNVYF